MYIICKLICSSSSSMMMMIGHVISSMDWLIDWVFSIGLEPEAEDIWNMLGKSRHNVKSRHDFSFGCVVK